MYARIEACDPYNIYETKYYYSDFSLHFPNKPKIFRIFANDGYKIHT